MSAEAGRHPDPGRTTNTKKTAEEFAGGTSKREMGRVSLAGKAAQAHRDSGKT